MVGSREWLRGALDMQTVFPYPLRVRGAAERRGKAERDSERAGALVREADACSLFQRRHVSLQEFQKFALIQKGAHGCWVNLELREGYQSD